MAEKGKERIAKLMARAGLCSRRDAERWIAAGRVSVNGDTLDTPAFTVGAQDRVLVDGKPLPKAEATRLFLFHKPDGLITSQKDERGRPTVFDGLPPELPRLVSVGRLDLRTEGLLLLTNDGGLSRYLELPTTGWVRTYRVLVSGAVAQEKLDRLKQGLTYQGVRYGAAEAVLETPPRTKGARQSATDRQTEQWIRISLREGKNREVRNLMEALGLRVTRLIRVSYGPFQLTGLPKGALKEVPAGLMKKKISGYFK